MEKTTAAMDAVLKLQEGLERARKYATATMNSQWFNCGMDTTLVDNEEYQVFEGPSRSRSRSFDGTLADVHLNLCNASLCSYDSPSMCTYDGEDERGENDSLVTKETVSTFVHNKPDLSRSKAELPLMMGYLDNNNAASNTLTDDDGTFDGTFDSTFDGTFDSTYSSSGKYDYDTHCDEAEHSSYYETDDYDMEKFGMNIVGLVTDVVTSKASWSSQSIDDQTHSTRQSNSNNNTDDKTAETGGQVEFDLAPIESRDGTIFKQDKESSSTKSAQDGDLSRELPSFGKRWESRSVGSKANESSISSQKSQGSKDSKVSSSSQKQESDPNSNSNSFKPTFVTPNENHQLEEENNRFNYLTRSASSMTEESTTTYGSETMREESNMEGVAASSSMDDSIPSATQAKDEILEDESNMSSRRCSRKKKKKKMGFPSLFKKSSQPGGFKKSAPVDASDEAIAA